MACRCGTAYEDSYVLQTSSKTIGSAGVEGGPIVHPGRTRRGDDDSYNVNASHSEGRKRRKSVNDDAVEENFVNMGNMAERISMLASSPFQKSNNVKNNAAYNQGEQAVITIQKNETMYISLGESYYAL